jgi:hypothetical protein
VTDLLRLLDQEQEILSDRVSHYRRRPRQTPVDEDWYLRGHEITLTWDP